jgi:hypothetical protein
MKIEVVVTCDKPAQNLKYRLTPGTRLAVGESAKGLVLTPLEPARSARRRAGWRALRGLAKGTNALKEHLAEHRRETKR